MGQYYHARMARHAQHLQCERSEPADNRLDKANKALMWSIDIVKLSKSGLIFDIWTMNGHDFHYRGDTQPARGSKLTLRSNGRRMSSVKIFKESQFR